jgi:hypothetical protein
METFYFLDAEHVGMTCEPAVYHPFLNSSNSSNSLNSLPFVPLKIIANIGAISSSLV